MSDYTITISDSLYEKARQVAQQTAQPVDEVIRARLEGAFDGPALDLAADERAELAALAYLSNDALFNMMREQMQRAKQQRLSALMEKNSRGTIETDEYDQLTLLVEDGQRLMLRKAEAMRLLMDRGFTVTTQDMQSLDE
jgi:hypothetical protein